MTTLKRLFVWFVEMSGEALLLGMLWAVLHNAGLLFSISATVGVFMFGSGYLVTTAVLRALWGGPRLLLYSTVAVALFLTHLQIFFVATGGLTMSERLRLTVGGICAVFACTLVGGWFLRKWEQRAAKS
jgi:hypothetical protein